MPVAIAGGFLLKRAKASGPFYVRLTNVSVVSATQTSITLGVCGGTPSAQDLSLGGVGGAGAGVVVRWLNLTDFLANGGDVNNPATYPTAIACPATAPSALAAGGCEQITIGSAGGLNGCNVIGLDCGTTYVFSLQAAANPALGIAISDRVLIVASTLACSAGCTFTLGYWKTHPNVWPATALPMMLGSVSYTQAQLLTIFNTPPKGNGLLTLEHQLIAAKLNLANGGTCPTAQTLVSQADALIGSLNPLQGGFLDPTTVGNLVTQLDNFNNGLLPNCPGHCS